MAGRDITEGRATRAIAVELGVGTGTIWQNTGVAYDCALAGIPFFMAVNDQHPYERATAPFRKQQFDSQRDPGEQSLTGWWLRSQSSFHTGEGIIFYDPFANPYSTTLPTNSYRIKSAYGVNIWEPGQVTLLRDVVENHQITTALNSSNGRARQTMRTIKWDNKQGLLLHDGYDVDRIDSDGNVEHYVDYTAGTNDPVYALCDDGNYAYWVTNDIVGGKLDLRKKQLTAAATSASASMFTKPGITVTNAAIEYVKQRIVLAANNAIYEFPTSATVLPTAVYTHPNTSYVFTSIAESGTAVYVAGFSGVQSSIFKFTLDTSGAMPTLTSAITAAEMPEGEKIYKIYQYLGYLCIGTSKGVRIAEIKADGSLTYGPLIVETQQPVYDFCARDRFVWCAAGVSTDIVDPGLIRIDLSVEIDNLRFAYAKDLHYDTGTAKTTTACAFIGETDRIAFCTANDGTVNGHYYTEHATNLVASGYLETGLIRFNTLEQKNFKRLVGHGDFTHGSMTLATVALDGNIYDVNSYDSVIGSPESTITQPVGAQDAIGLRFTLYRDSTTASDGPVFKGYQLKALPATPRNRIIKIPVLNFDTETDKYNLTVGYEGRAFQRLAALESAESSGDIVTWQDLRTGEVQQCLIEELDFIDTTPPDKRLTNFGGILTITIRTV